MADNDHLYEFVDSPDKPKLAGSVFINNTTYHGCDIKVVVNMYNTRLPTSIAEGKIREIESLIKKAEQDIEKARRDGTGTNDAFNQAKVNSAEWQALSNRLARLGSSINTNQNFIYEMQQEKARLQNTIVPASTKVLAEAQTLSLSVFRDKQAVRSCGTVYPRGFTRGPRQIAGSMVFTVFNEHVLYSFLEAHASDFDAIAFTSAVVDQIPPVDITIAFANEYGAISRMTILGAEFVSEGQTMSVEDLITENTVSFVARDFDPMRSVTQAKLDENSRLVAQYQPIKASDLILEEDFQAYKGQISPFERFRRRRNPFL